jgi:hypothetical protein
MSTDRDALAVIEAECRVFSRFLVSQEPAPYVLDSYARLRHSATPADTDPTRLIERALLSVAQRGPTAVAIADSYAKFFVPRSLLRCRLVLLLAILENSPRTERVLNSATEGGPAAIIFSLLLVGIAVTLRLGAGLVLFLPVHALSLATGRSGASR